MSYLKLLEMEAVKYIDDQHLGGKKKLDPNKISEFVSELDETYQLDEFNQAVDAAMDKYGEGDTEVDQFLAPKIHDALPLSRREAADPRLWNYLGCMERRDYVRYRWTSMNRRRFVMRTSTVRHAFARLWWIAELTKTDEGYQYTTYAFSKQDIAQNIFDNNYSHYKPFNRHILDELKDQPSEVAKKTGEILNRKFAVLLEEGLDNDKLGELAEHVVQQARKELGMSTSGLAGWLNFGS